MSNFILPLQVVSLFAAGSTVATFGAVVLDKSTNVPLGAVLGAGSTVLLVGMWMGRKLTRVDDKLEAIEERLSKIEGHVDSLPCKQPNCPGTPSPGSVKRK